MEVMVCGGVANGVVGNERAAKLVSMAAPAAMLWDCGHGYAPEFMLSMTTVALDGGVGNVCARSIDGRELDT